MIRLTAVVVATAVVALLQVRPAARHRQDPRQVFRGNVDLVQIDVVVLDAQGHPVRGLTKDDFTLKVDGAVRAIDTVAEVVHAPRPRDFGLEVQEDVARNDTRPDRLVMLVLDDLHFRGRTEEVKSLVRRIVSGLGTGAALGLVTTSGTFGVEITEDRARLLHAIDGFLDRFDPGRGLRAPVVSTAGRTFSETDDGRTRITVSPTGAMSLTGGPSDPASFFGAISGYRTVEDVARMVAAEDGRRKVFIWIASSLPGANLTGAAIEAPGAHSPCESVAAAWVCGSISTMFDGLRAAGVSVFAVSPGGPTDGGDPLAPIAANAGGAALDAGADPGAVDALLAALDNYYMVGFPPAGPLDTRTHDVEITVNRPGVIVRHRSAYALATPAPLPRDTTPLAALARPVEPIRDLPVRLNVVPFFTAKGTTQVLATLDVIPDDRPPADADGHYRDTVEFGVFAVDLRRKKADVSDARRVPVEWSGRDEGWQRLPPFRLQTAFEIRPGAYQFRASVMSAALGRSGSVYLQLDVPPAHDEAIALSGLALAPQGDLPDVPVVRSTPITDVVLPFAPSTSRVFSTAGGLRVFFQLLSKDDAPVAGRVRLLDAAGGECLGAPFERAERGLHQFEFTLPLADLAAGPYRLVVEAASGATTIRRELGIRLTAEAGSPTPGAAR
ncbi:MAG: hypothetical protein R2752_10345 [Vicinamibacterales bacterium]